MTVKGRRRYKKRQDYGEVEGEEKRMLLSFLTIIHKDGPRSMWLKGDEVNFDLTNSGFFFFF